MLGLKFDGLIIQPLTFVPIAPVHETGSAGLRSKGAIKASFVRVSDTGPLPSAFARKISFGRAIVLREKTSVLPSALTLTSPLKPSARTFFTGPPLTETE